MKKFSKILLSLTLVLVAFVGLIGFTGCGNGNGGDSGNGGKGDAGEIQTVTFDVAIAQAYDNLLNCKNVKIVVNRYVKTSSTEYNFHDELIRTNNLVKIPNATEYKSVYLNLDTRKYYGSGEEFDASNSSYKDYLNNYLLMTEKFHARAIDIAKVNEDARTISIVNNKYVLTYSSSITSNNTVRVEISSDFKVTAIVFDSSSSGNREVYDITYEYGVEELVYPVA